MSKTVEPKDARGMNKSITQLWGSGPKWTITCGACEGTFRERIPIIDEPGIACPYCHAINKLPLVVARKS